MDGFVTYEKYTTMKRDFEREFINFKKKIEPCALKTEVVVQINELQDAAFERMKLFSHKKDCMKDKVELRNS